MLPFHFSTVGLIISAFAINEVFAGNCEAELERGKKECAEDGFTETLSNYCIEYTKQVNNQSFPMIKSYYVCKPNGLTMNQHHYELDANCLRMVDSLQGMLDDWQEWSISSVDYALEPIPGFVTKTPNFLSRNMSCSQLFTVSKEGVNLSTVRIFSESIHHRKYAKRVIIDFGELIKKYREQCKKTCSDRGLEFNYMVKAQNRVFLPFATIPAMKDGPFDQGNEYSFFHDTCWCPTVHRTPIS